MDFFEYAQIAFQFVNADTWYVPFVVGTLCFLMVFCDPCERGTEFSKGVSTHRLRTAASGKYSRWKVLCRGSFT